jgi:hypothetical protein
LTGLVPAQYIVTENPVIYYPPTGPSFTPIGFGPTGGPQQTVDLSLDSNNKVQNCAGSANFVNAENPTSYAKAQVKKLTTPVLASGDPDYAWTFTISGPGIASTPVSANANGDFVIFPNGNGPLYLPSSGTYTITETQKTGWFENSASGDGGVSTKDCSFTVTYPYDYGKTFSCTFSNTKYGKAQVVKTVQGKPWDSTMPSFTFQLRQNASMTDNGLTLESRATGTDGGTLNFSTQLVPGNHYQLCEVVSPGWSTTLSGFVPSSFMPPNGVATNPAVDNSTLCVDFTVAAGDTKTFSVDNAPPPGGLAMTIGYWKNWASCTASSTSKAPVLDKTLFGAANGIKVGKVLSQVVSGGISFFGQNPTQTADCPHAVALLNKTDFSGAKRASDPLFNMAAQLVAAELNIAAGAGSCPPVSTTIVLANNLLDKYSFNGYTYAGKLSSADATSANNWAQKLDDYNNDRPSACK